MNRKINKETFMSNWRNWLVRKGILPLTRQRKLIALGVLLLLAGVATAWYLGSESQVDRVRRLGQELTSEASKNLSSEDRKEAWKNFGQEMKKLSPQQREQLQVEREKQFVQKDAQKLERFFKLSKEEQLAELDKDIDRMQEGFKRFEEMRSKWKEGEGKGGKGFGRGGFPGGGPGGGGPGGGPDGRPGRKGFGGGPKGGPDGQQPGAVGKGGFGGKSGWKSATPEQREQRQKNRLDATTPEYRAQKTEFRRLIKERMENRGLTMPTFSRRGGPPF